MSTVSTLSSRLCGLLDFEIGTKEMVNYNRQIKQFPFKLQCGDNNNETFTRIACGSMAEGFVNISSDSDFMLVLPNFLITQHDELRESDNMQLRMIYDTHHRGSVLLEPMNVCALPFQSDMYKGRFFLANDKFKNLYIPPLSVLQRFPIANSLQNIGVNGPCVTSFLHGMSFDICLACKCNEWPRIAQEFIQRRRRFEWPPSVVINHISNDGCYCVPIGDQISEHTRLQWRISFAPAEVKLVHTFSHVAFKVYALLKIVYGDLLNKILDDIDGKPLLCSYFLKTIMFYVKENSPLSIWTESNMLNCFFLCFNFLIQSVEKGMLCHYFIPANNLFRRRIYGRNRHALLEYLYALRRKGVGILLECPTLHWLLDAAYADQLVPFIPAVSECHYFTHILCQIPIFEAKEALSHRILNLCLYRNLHDDGTMFTLLRLLQLFIMTTSSELFASTVESTLDNKQMYHRRRTCRRYLLAAAHLDASQGWLALATYHYLLGQHRLARSLSQQVIQTVKHCTIIDGKIVEKNTYTQQGIPLLTKMRLFVANSYPVNLISNQFYPAEIFPEITSGTGTNILCDTITIRPQVYAEFLSFICYHQMSDTSGQHKALSNLLALQSDDIQGIHLDNVNPRNYLLYNMIGICFEMIGDYQNAEVNYIASARKKHEFALVARQRATNLRRFLERFH